MSAPATQPTPPAGLQASSSLVTVPPVLIVFLDLELFPESETPLTVFERMHAVERTRVQVQGTQPAVLDGLP
jgi:hypothetical protein